MTFTLGVPQVIVLLLYLCSMVVSCVRNGEQTTTSWGMSLAGVMLMLFLLTWGGFFS